MEQDIENELCTSAGEKVLGKRKNEWHVLGLSWGVT